ncbi:EcsC family protein [Pseudoxanthomonas winnipegensis]|uniref:EcsC family protein n=1 Tax=Pseudoxanthomonas winnipegensis TaxID=2480810 RepID=A0A4Q8M1M6_9GAMM|nr:EcsC family protein [Pseudoxanthomonas winnipegensis]TAA39652.1 EcsC family protein [Pseudoxanthomonas winnipegensis]
MARAQPLVGELIPAGQAGTLGPHELEQLRQAVRRLEHPSFGARVANLVGAPVERLVGFLPRRAHALIAAATRKAIGAALRLSLITLDTRVPAEGARKSSDWWHLGATSATGAFGGAFGLTALAIELPLTTTIMLRSIADIARSEGADLNDPAVRLECVRVLAMGGPSSADDAAEVGYYAAREAMSRMVADAATHVARHGLQKEGAPVLVGLVKAIAERYSIQVSEKAAAQWMPVLGALGGATVNAVFTDHFQSMARGHFVVRRLERLHGPETVRVAYEALARLMEE